MFVKQLLLASVAIGAVTGECGNPRFLDNPNALTRRL